MTARDAYLNGMANRLKRWAAQLDELDAKARAATPGFAATVAIRLKALRQRHVDYAAQFVDAHDADGPAFRNLQVGTERMVHNFRRAYLEALNLLR